MRLETSGRELVGTLHRISAGGVELDAVPETARGELAKAFAATAVLLNVTDDPDRVYVLSAGVTGDVATVSVRAGEPIAAPDPGSPSIFEAQR